MNEISLNIPTIDSIKELMVPIVNEIISLKGVIKTPQLDNQFYRNKDLKTKFGFSDKTIQAYRESNTIPFTKIGDIYFYPVSKFDELSIANSNYDLFEKKKT